MTAVTVKSKTGQREMSIVITGNGRRNAATALLDASGSETFDPIAAVEAVIDGCIYVLRENDVIAMRVEIAS